VAGGGPSYAADLWRVAAADPTWTCTTCTAALRRSRGCHGGAAVEHYADEPGRATRTCPVRLRRRLGQAAERHLVLAQLLGLGGEGAGADVAALDSCTWGEVQALGQVAGGIAYARRRAVEAAAAASRDRIE